VVAKHPGAPGGLIPIASVPFDQSERIDVACFETALEHLRMAKVDGIMVPGFASEFYKLSDAESRLLASTVIDFCRELDAISSVISISAHSTISARDNARWAIDYGADALNLLLPHYLSPSASSVTTHLRAVLREAGDTPVMVQYAPQLTGGAVSLDDIVNMSDEYPNLCAIKLETMPPGPDVERILSRNASLNVLVGYAGMHMIDALERGAVGVQPSASFVEIYRQIMDRWSEGDFELARHLHRKLLPYVAYWMQSVELVVAVDKRVAFLRGWFASDSPRRPSRTLDDHELATVDSFLREFSEILL
jgi:4-hydroxy-tetrahydrodipicolinate synthase